MPGPHHLSSFFPSLTLCLFVFALSADFSLNLSPRHPQWARLLTLLFNCAPWIIIFVFCSACLFRPFLFPYISHFLVGTGKERKRVFLSPSIARAGPIWAYMGHGEPIRPLDKLWAHTGPLGPYRPIMRPGSWPFVGQIGPNGRFQDQNELRISFLKIRNRTYRVNGDASGWGYRVNGYAKIRNVTNFQNENS